MSNFDVFIERVLDHEGGYVNDPRDPGGETQWGISKRAFPWVNIKTLTRKQAIELYREYYWNRARCEEFPKALQFQILDAAINHGIGNSIRWLQRAVDVADDGVVGPVTITAVADYPADAVVLAFNAERLDFYTKLSTWDRYGRGWTRRIATNLQWAVEDSM